MEEMNTQSLIFYLDSSWYTVGDFMLQRNWFEDERANILASSAAMAASTVLIWTESVKAKEL